MLNLKLHLGLWQLIREDAKKAGKSPAAFIHNKLKEMYGIPTD